MPVQASVKEAVKSAAAFLNAAAKVVLVIGSQVKTCRAQKQALELADACQYPIAVMPRSKGMFPETHPRYWPIDLVSHSVLGKGLQFGV